MLTPLGKGFRVFVSCYYRIYTSYMIYARDLTEWSQSVGDLVLDSSNTEGLAEYKTLAS